MWVAVLLVMFGLKIVEKLPTFVSKNIAFLLKLVYRAMIHIKKLQPKS
jgi:hypothetical protein